MNLLRALYQSNSYIKRNIWRCLLALSCLGMANVAAPSEDLASKMKITLNSIAIKPIQIESVRPSPVIGWSEVAVKDGPIIYATHDGEFLFLNGDLYQTQKFSLVNLTEERRASSRLDLLAAIPVDQMVVFSPKSHVLDSIVVFTDITCGFCRKLHREVNELNSKGVEVRYLAFPRGGVDSEGAKKLATAWCARDQAKTLTELKAGIDMPLNSCRDNPIAEQYQLGQKLGVSGTPAVITSSGQMIPGYRSAQDLITLLNLD